MRSSSLELKRRHLLTGRRACRRIVRPDARKMNPSRQFLGTGRLAASALLCLAVAAGGGGCARKVETRAAAPAPTPALTSAPSTAAPARAADAGYALRPAEQAAVDEFLRRNPNLRGATDADHRRAEEADGVETLYGVYHPYFVRGDDNDDGLLDFVLAFVRRDSDRDTPWFSVVVFAGKADGSFEPGVFLERDISLADGDLSVERDSIVVTPDVSDDVARRYRWDPSKQRHVFVRDDASEEPASPPSQI